MTWPFGKAAQQVGTVPTPAEMPVYEGTTSAEMQRIIGAQFSTSGILPSGGVSVKGTARMSYLVTPGAVVLKDVSGKGLLYAVEQTEVFTDPSPSTGYRTDRIVMDRDGGIYVTQGAAPGGGITLGLFTVPAGITATTSAQQSVDRNYAIPAGASLGLLHQFHDPANNTIGNPNAMELGKGRFFLPSDRYVRFDMTHCLSAVQESNSDQPSAAIRWRVYIDQQLELAFTTRVTRAAPQTNFMSFTVSLQEGAHQVHYVQDQIEGLSGPGWRHHKGTNQGYPGNRFEVWDAGSAR